MQDVNNDIDDLFRKASEEYPLQTGGANWEKVLARLDDDNNDTFMPAALTTNGKKHKRRMLWLLLLPLGLLFTTLHYFSGSKKNPSTTVKNKEQNRVAKSQADSLKKKNQDANHFNKNKKFIPASDGNNTQQFDASGNERLGKTNVLIIKNKNNKESKQTGFLLSETKDKTADARMNETGEAEKKTKVVNDKNSIASKQPETEMHRIETMATAHDGSKNSLAQQRKTDSTISSKTDSVIAKNNTEKKNKNKKVKAETQRRQGFYAGVLAGFDISTIKLQKVNKTGYGFTVLAGYRFSKHVSAETGLNWTSKKYYSTGKYFDKSRTNIPAESKIIYTNGVCAMFEVPVVIKYDFALKQKSNLFVTAGLSSYFMKNEKYNYYANHNGDFYDAERKYKNSGSNWFSVADVSIGYQLYLNKRTTLRAEPYLKMPLTGIGIAKLPITSTGISVGITRSF